MTEPTVRIQVHEHIGTITLNRPDKRNALSRGMLEELEQAFRDLHGERRVRAVVLAGAGPAFCAGTDLAEVQAGMMAADAQSRWQEDALDFRDVLLTMLRFPKPIIATLHGPAFGHGAALALAADVVLASPEARFGLPEPNHGLVAGLSAPLLNFRLGAGRAAYLLLSGQTLDAAEAHRLGVVHELVDAKLLWARAAEIAGAVAHAAPQSILLTKRLLNETIGEQLETLLSAAAAATATGRTTDAATEGLTAFVEKREAKWE